ncbi:MAG: efflux RND transporter periplasmic adaptor subunit, partial [Actinomycetota bacterium]|nr:efflux RND transporter periplasmic adaptor subunit [Actinomycetota bacterium]
PGGLARRQALASVRAAQAQYAAAQAQARDAVRRFEAGLGSLASALSALSEAQRVQTRAAVEAARRTVSELVVRAPVSGTVSLGQGSEGGGDGGNLAGALGALPESVRGQAEGLVGGGGGGASVQGTLEEGMPVGSGDTVATITDTSSLSLRAEVDETDVLLVRRGVRGEVELDAVPGASYDAEVASVDVRPTTSQRGGVSYVVRLTLGAGRTDDGEPAPVPRPGMSAVADLRVRTARDAVAVPASAVFHTGRKEAVWVIESGRARRRPVRLGAQGESSVQVVEGLKPGERVVVGGADKVAEGQEVA